MDDLLIEFQTKISRISLSFQRSLISQIDLSNRLIAIKGARGAGKTTLLLQLAKLIVPNKRIVSIYGMFDPHIPEGSSLDGARNVQIPSSYGHFRPLKNPDVLREVLNSINKMDVDKG